MHLRKYVRQIRPIQENYIKPEDKIQFLFTEEVNLPQKFLVDYLLKNQKDNRQQKEML